MKLALVVLAVVFLSSCSTATSIRTDVVKPAFQEETKWIKLAKQMGDAYWAEKDFKAGLATGLASISPQSPEVKMAIDNLNKFADINSENYKKGMGLGYWLNYLWYGSQDIKDRVVPPILQILRDLGVL